MDAAQRLVTARKRRFDSGPEAAAALGLSYNTYAQYENGTRGFTRHAERFARFFHVRLDWLVSGRGDIVAESTAIAIDGAVGAGPGVSTFADEAAASRYGQIVMPGDGHLGGLIVEGDSQMPRWRKGEVIVYDRRPARPEDLLGCYAVVRNADGERLLKIIRRGIGDNRWTLESHNAEPLEGVFLIGAHRVVATIHRHPASLDDELPAPVLSKSKARRP